MKIQTLVWVLKLFIKNLDTGVIMFINKNRIKMISLFLSVLTISSTNVIADTHFADNLFSRIKNKTYDAYFNIREATGLSDEKLFKQFNMLLNSLPKDIDLVETHLPLTLSFDSNIVGLISSNTNVQIKEQIEFDNGNYLAVKLKMDSNTLKDLVNNEKINFRNQNEIQDQTEFYIVFTKDELVKIYKDSVVLLDKIKNEAEQEKVEYTYYLFNQSSLDLVNRKYLMLEPKVEEEDTVVEKIQDFIEDTSFTDFFNPVNAIKFFKDSVVSIFETEIDFVRNHLSLLKSNSKSINMVISKRCSSFINLESEYKQHEWGQYIENRILPESQVVGYSKIIDSEYVKDIKYYCTKYDSMPDKEKAKVWSWVILSMANAESSCRPDVVVKGVNDQAVGLLQLPASQKYLRGSGGQVCMTINPKKPLENIECGLNILNMQFGKSNKLFISSEDLKNGVKKSYWQVLMGHQQRVKDALNFYQPCKAE